MIVCAGRNEVFDFAHPIGVGLIESTMNLTRLALFDKPDFLLFIGSAGSYGKHKIFDIIHSKTAANIELGFLDNKCYTPLKNVISSEENQNVPRETLNIVNSSNYITTDNVSSKKFLKLGLELENMEFFALLNVAKEYDIPVAGIFIVTNYCDENAHKDFIKNHSKAKELLTKYMKEYNGKS
ncbi:purine-nucleoside phosphorylase [Sulfurospirillum arcachonense]|uniref:phosphorylase family protein n=1 Tax=Sulfurospirillum arcachonense TaxID=57666 RepID=UPI000469973C|nr:purine-nucleoside phosphorylase [Sulfurospirillum arcachonense]